MRGLEEAREPRPTATRCGCAKPALETGNLLTEPIGYLESCFSAKNGTPRQPSICSQSRACLRIRKSIFNNPEHSLMGLEQFSHVWILFVFHKNGHLSYKAKVQPPRLNGAKTGVFSTRSPHRPNAIGLTLATLEKVEGGAVYLTGIDMIHGTPVLDIKPYIADYDSPQNLMKPLGSFNLQNNKPRTASQSDDRTDSCDQELFLGTEEKLKCLEDRASEENSLKPSDNTETPCSSPGCRDRAAGLELESRSNESVGMAELQLGPQEPKNFPEPRSVEGTMILQCNGAETEPAASCPARTADRVPGSMVPTWVKEAPAPPLQVRFTPHAEMDLEQLSSGSRAHSRLRMKEAAGCEEVEMVMPARSSQFPRSRTQTDAGQVSFKYFQSTEEAKCAIKAVLAADPRSVYRRKLCQDRLFYFSVDIVHVTCWFGDGFAEVLRVKLASEPVQMTDPKQSLVTLGS